MKGTAPSTGERSFVLVPRPRRVGPGRIERDYQRRIDELEQGASAGHERLRAAELDRLVQAWRPHPQRIVVACWSEGQAYVTGPPVIFPTRFLHELKAIPPDRGARQVIDQHMDDVEFVELQNAADDLDRPEDLAELRRTD